MRGFKVLGINHVGLAPKDPTMASQFLVSFLGLPHMGNELVAEQMTQTMMYGSQSTTTDANAPRLEILANEDGKDGPIAKFLTKKGSGIHHVALSVDHIEAAISYLRSMNIKMIDERPRKGAHDTLIAFVHPEATGGLLLELVEQIVT